MKFDERARRATQGIHRAVEVMELSSTKTPQKITRFDQYRARTSRNQRIVAIAVGVGVPLMFLIGAVRFLGSNPDPTVPLAPPSVSVSPTPERPYRRFRGAVHVHAAPRLDGLQW